MLKNIIWDLDGTLIHSSPDLRHSANLMLAEYGFAPLDLPTIESFIGNGVPKLVERCLRVYGQPLTDDAVTKMRKHYDADPTQFTKPYQGVVECLSILNAKGHKMCLCTNKPVEPAITILKNLGLDHFFDIVVGGDSYAHHKPNAEPLLGCVSQMEVEVVDCVYVGDSEIDVQTAINGKMTFALFSGGYRKTPVDQLKHDFLFDDFAKLTEYLT